MSRLTSEELRELRRLNVQLGRRVDSLFAGDYRAAVRGRGMEFEEVRSYLPGDDIRHIDWNVTARTGEAFIKVFREERQNTLVLAVDISGSTDVGGGGRDGRTDRRLQIARIAGGLAYAGIRNRDRVGLVTFSNQVETYLSPRPDRAHAWAVIQSVFAAERVGTGTNLAEAIGFLARTQRRRAVVVLVSDFLDDGPWQRPLATLARRHEVHALVVSDALDAAGMSGGLMELVDAETGDTVLVDGWRGVDSTVEDRLRTLTRCGARAVEISTEADPYLRMHRHFQALGARR
jgi:uncharacterized protein (DUF58 family)